MHWERPAYGEGRSDSGYRRTPGGLNGACPVPPTTPRFPTNFLRPGRGGGAAGDDVGTAGPGQVGDDVRWQAPGHVPASVINRSPFRRPAVTDESGSRTGCVRRR